MKFLRIGICALVVFAVAAHGAVEDGARAVLEIGAGFLFLFWAVRSYFAYEGENRVVVTPLLPPLLLLASLALGQFVLRATASTYSTRTELALLVAELIVLFLAAQAFQTAED